MKKSFYIIKKTTHNYYGVDFSRVDAVDISCKCLENTLSYIGVKKGDRVRIVSGRKYPIGTEGTVKYAGINKFGSEHTQAITGNVYHFNPSILLTLDDGSEIWTCGNNCINITGPEEIHEFNSEEEANNWQREIDSQRTKDYWVYKDDCVQQVGWKFGGLGSQGFAVHKGMIKETEDEVVAVLDDFRYDVYYFVRFSKKVEAGNLIQMVDTGSHRNMDDMWRGDTGLGDALKAFEEYVA